MNLQDFYPTPAALIRQMLTGINLDLVADILEPSAGKGDICDALRSRIDGRGRRGARIDTIEINANLQHILRGKGYNLIHDDFLTFRSNKRYDLIVANFPFGAGAAHLQKAISLLEGHGGSLVCLVNAETVRNPHTNQRKAIAATLERYGATVEYIADAFRDAERSTDVEVALIRLRVPRVVRESTLLQGLRQADAIAREDAAPTDLVETDPVRALVARFDMECRAGVRLISEYEALRPLMLKRMKKTERADATNTPIIELKVSQAERYTTDHVNDYVRAVRHKYWKALIGDDKFRQVYTSNVLNDLNGHLERLKDYDFTIFNIMQLQEELAANLSIGIEDAIIAMFDDFSRKFSYSDSFGKNLHYYNGWKSNKAHKINKRVILPVNGFNRHSWGKLGLDDYYIKDKIGDLVKALNYLSGDLVDVGGTVTTAIESANELTQFRNIDFHYFTATFYLKGTCHITFKDLKLLDKLNIYGSQRKGWLPPSYGKRAYADMAAEEQQVIDEFQGEQAYAEVIRERAYYLAEPVQLMLSDRAA